MWEPESGRRLGSSVGWSKGIHSTQERVGWPESGAEMSHHQQAEVPSGMEGRWVMRTQPESWGPGSGPGFLADWLPSNSGKRPNSS